MTDIEKRAILVSNDLMLVSQIELECRRASVSFCSVGPGDIAGSVSSGAWVFWDLRIALGDVAVLNELRADFDLCVVAFGPHVEHRLLAAAREAGCDLVLSRGSFLNRLPEILGQARSEDGERP